MASLLLDGLLVCLLTATIVYSIILDRRLRTFRQARDEMQALLANFTAATSQAQSSMAALRDASQTTSTDLTEKLERGKSLRDDLNYLVDRGGSLADRLEGGVSAARASVKTADTHVKPAVHFMESLANPPVSRRSAEAKAEAAEEPRLEPRAAKGRVVLPRGAVLPDVARDYLRTLKTAR